jgi:hypothetical protein
MTEKELQSMARSIHRMTEITDGLWRKCLRNEAWIAALHAPLRDLMANQTGKSKKQITAYFSDLQKSAYQKLLEKIEKADPGLAARLDKRGIEDVL